MRYTSLAISDPSKLIFGVAPKPLTTRSGMVIGGGRVYPELNFTLPALTIDQSSWKTVCQHYRDIVKGALERAAELESPGIVLECETLPPMTERSEWCIELCKILMDGMAEAKAKHGLKSALRMTPNDNREMERPPVLRSGKYWEEMLKSFEGCAKLGADFLSIESVGGKEIHDDALTMCDLRQVIFGLGVLGARDMGFLWPHIVGIAKKHGVYAAGDSACGFGNTAMVLAEQKLIPHVFAAVVRPITAVRALVAHECGAVGPGKDCAYENPILKAITGCPMSMEGKTATCAHLSPVGNIAAATCDLWSNESVQNIKLLAGMAPTCYVEALEYDCRLFHQSTLDGEAGRRQLQKWLVNSDAALDPQAYVLTPENTIEFAKAIVGAKTHYESAVAVARKAVEILKKGQAAGKVKIAEREASFLDMMEASIDSMPATESEAIDLILPELDRSKFLPGEYGIKG